MGILTPAIVYRKWNVDGVPDSLAHDPLKSEIIQLLELLFGVSRGGWVVAKTRAELLAVTPTAETDGGVVLNDPNPTLNGYYQRDAAVWVRERGFPDSLAVLIDVGGTANDITAMASAGVDPSSVQMVIIPIPPGTNTAGAATLTVSGTTWPIKSASGSNLAAGDIVAGIGTALFRFGAEWRQLISSSVAAKFDHQGDWSAAVTYAEGQVVTGSNGNWYILKVPSSLNDNPVSGGTGNWLLVLSAGGLGDGAVTRAKLADAPSASLPVSVIERGASGGGIANDRDAINTAQGLGPLHFTAGSYRLGTNLEITAASTFEPGAMIIVATGVTLTLTGDVFAGSYQIFTIEGTGAIVANTSTSALSEIKADWFDPAYVGDSTVTRGRFAGHGVLGHPGLSGLDYCHIDGFMAARDTVTGLEGMAIGTYAGAAAASLLSNTLVGYSAGRGEQVSGLNFRGWTGSNVTAVGSGALNDILAASSVTAVGSGAMKEFETGGSITAVGANVARLGKIGSEQVWIGAAAAYNVGTTGLAADNIRSVAVGHNALNNATQSYRNTVVGSLAGTGLQTGQENTFLGHFSGPASVTYGTVSRAIAVGNLAATRADDTITIGNGLTETTAGAIRIGGAAQTSAYVAGIYASTSATAANVVVDANGRLYRSTSSGEYKTAIEPLTEEWANKVLELEPVYYRSLCTADNPDFGWYGLIAEDAAKADPRFATWGRKPVFDEAGAAVVDEFGGQVLEDELSPNGVPYDRLVVSLLAVVKRQENAIRDLTKRLSMIEKSTKS